MEYTEKIFAYVEKNNPIIWKQMLELTKLHKISSVKKIFTDHLNLIDDINIFNENIENIPVFLLKFCESIQRNFLSPGESYGTLLTCRASKIYTQNVLDKRHLRDTNCDRSKDYSICKSLLFEINIYSTLSQIYEITNKRTFTTLFVKEYTVKELMNLNKNETCYLTALNAANKASTLKNGDVYINFKSYIILESFVPEYYKIIASTKNKNNILKRLDKRKIVAFTDLKYIYKHCGLICYFFNLIMILKLQFFKKMELTESHEKDIQNILRYQVYTGILLPINRNGLKANSNRSGLDKLSFEAIKQNYVVESIKHKEYLVQSSIDKIFFGQQFNEGSGYNFDLLQA